jgi:hypothetical protein
VCTPSGVPGKRLPVGRGSLAGVTEGGKGRATSGTAPTGNCRKVPWAETRTVRARQRRGAPVKTASCRTPRAALERAVSRRPASLSSNKSPKSQIFNYPFFKQAPGCQCLFAFFVAIRPANRDGPSMAVTVPCTKTVLPPVRRSGPRIPAMPPTAWGRTRLRCGLDAAGRVWRGRRGLLGYAVSFGPVSVQQDVIGRSHGAPSWVTPLPTPPGPWPGSSR